MFDFSPKSEPRRRMPVLCLWFWKRYLQLFFRPGWLRAMGALKKACENSKSPGVGFFWRRQLPPGDDKAAIFWWPANKDLQWTTRVFVFLVFFFFLLFVFVFWFVFANKDLHWTTRAFDFLVSFFFLVFVFVFWFVSANKPLQMDHQSQTHSQPKSELQGK